MPQEWVNAAVSAALSLVFGGIGGAIVSEWRTRRAEGRAEERERKRGRRDDVLRAIDDTRRSFHRQQKYLVERKIAGWPEGQVPDDIGRHLYLHANIELVSDQAVIDDLAMFIVLTLSVREPGTLTADEWRRFFTSATRSTQRSTPRSILLETTSRSTREPRSTPPTCARGSGSTIIRTAERGPIFVR